MFSIRSIRPFLFQSAASVFSMSGATLRIMKASLCSVSGITLYPAGLHTGDGEMDETLQGPDFFDAAQFPRVRFVSSTVKLLDKDNATIAGQLTVLGVTKPFTLDVHFKGKEYEPESGDYVVSFTASGIIRRSDFGMSYLTPIIGDEVHLRIQAQGIDRPHVTP